MSEKPKEEDGIVEGKHYTLGWLGASKITEKLNNVKLVTFLLIIYAMIISAMSDGASFVNFGILKTRFSLNNTDVEFMQSGFDIAFGVLTIFLAYFGNHYNRMKLISFGCIVYGFGTFIYALPHFTSGLYEYGGPVLKLPCEPDFAPDCSFDNSEFNFYKYILFVGYLIMGGGAASFFVFGLSYVDDSVSQRHSPLYLGMISGAYVVGPAIGIIAGGIIRKNYYIDFDRKAESKLPYYDVRWIGAWWLYPMITVGLSFLVAVPFLGYPQHLPGTAKHRQSRKIQATISEHYEGSNIAVVENNGKSVYNFLRSIVLMIKDKTLICLIIAGCFQAFVVSGLISLLAVVFINYFNLESQDGSILAGIITVLAGGLGYSGSGLVVSKLNLSTRGIMRLCVIIMLAAIALSPSFLLYCANPKMPGVTMPYTSSIEYINENTFNLSAPCNSQCNCREQYFVAVCGTDNLTYFSPCHAGCTAAVAPYTYGFCSCVEENLPPGGSERPQTVVGPCRDGGCVKLWPFAILVLLLLTCIYFAYIPTLSATLRLVPLSLRTACIGLQTSLYHGVGFTPGFYVFGNLLKATACLAWQYSQCGGERTGSCLVYDHPSTAITLMCLTIFGCACALLFILLAIRFYQPVHIRNQKTINSEKKHSLEKRDSSEITRF